MAAANPPLVTCPGCGFEWDGRSAPPKKCPEPGEIEDGIPEFNHREMRGMWSDIKKSGLVRGADELPQEFMARMSAWDDKRP